MEISGRMAPRNSTITAKGKEQADKSVPQSLHHGHRSMAGKHIASRWRLITGLYETKRADRVTLFFQFLY